MNLFTIFLTEIAWSLAPMGATSIYLLLGPMTILPTFSRKNIPLFFFVVSASSQAFPLIPLYHQAETVDSNYNSLWNSVFNPFDHMMMSMNNFFSLQMPKLTENIVETVTEIENGYKKITETVELINEQGLVEGIETRYTIEYDPENFEEEKGAAGNLVPALSDTLEDIVDDVIEDLNQESPENVSEERDQGFANLLNGLFGNLFGGDSIDDDLNDIAVDQNSEIDHNLEHDASDVIGFVGVFPFFSEEAVDGQILEKTDDEDQDDGDDDVEEDQNDDDQKDDQQNEDEEYPVYDKQQEEDGIVNSILNSDMPEWMKQQILGSNYVKIEDDEEEWDEDEEDDDEDEDEDEGWDEDDDEDDDEDQENDDDDDNLADNLTEELEGYFEENN